MGCHRRLLLLLLLPSRHHHHCPPPLRPDLGGEGEEGRAATRSRGGEGVQGTVVVTTFFCCHRRHHRCPPPLRPDLGELKERRGESPSPRCRRRRALSELPNPVAPWSRCRDRGSLLQRCSSSEPRCHPRPATSPQSRRHSSPLLTPLPIALTRGTT